MSTTSDFKHVNKVLEQLSVVPENIQGSPNWKHKASGGTTTTFTIATVAGSGRDDANLLDAPDDFLNGLQVYVGSGALAGSIHKILDFEEAASVATLTVATMSGSPSSGDDIYIVGVLGNSNVSISGTVDQIEREFVSQSLDKAPVIKESKRWSGSFDAEVFGLETPLGNGVTPEIDRTAQLLAMFGTFDNVIGSDVDDTASTTNIPVTAPSNFVAGDFVMVNGESREIASVDATSITLVIALSAAPVVSDIVYGGEIWTPDNVAHKTCTLVHLIDDQVKEYYGGTISFKASGEWGGVVKWTLTVSGGEWEIEDAVAFGATELAKAPIEMLIGDVFFNGVALCMNSFEFDMASELQEIKDTCGGLRFGVRSRNPSIKCVWRDQDAVPKSTWEEYDDLKPIRASFGNAPGRAIAFAGQAQPGDVAESDINSTMFWDSTFMLRDAFTSLTHTPPKIIRF